jgi:hypothetical protein
MDRLRILSVAIVLIGVGGYAGAQTLVGTTTDPKGIDGVVIDGTTYNVTFITTTLNQSPFEQGTQASFTAAGVMAADLSLLGVTGLAGTTPPNDCPPDSHVCQQNAALSVIVDRCCGINPDVAYCLGDAAPAPSPCSLHSWIGSEGVVPFEISLGPTCCGFGYAANFTVAPEPGTLALLAAGLLGIGFARRKLTS